jgi:hypothetical protein
VGRQVGPLVAYIKFIGFECVVMHFSDAAATVKVGDVRTDFRPIAERSADIIRLVERERTFVIGIGFCTGIIRSRNRMATWESHRGFPIPDAFLYFDDGMRGTYASTMDRLFECDGVRRARIDAGVPQTQVESGACATVAMIHMATRNSLALDRF